VFISVAAFLLHLTRCSFMEHMKFFNLSQIVGSWKL